MKPEHHVNDLRETVGRIRETFHKCRMGCPPPGCPPEAEAKWEGAYMALRAMLTEELGPLLESWEKDEPHWRTTEKLIAGEDPTTVLNRAENG
jgi:hypothetical protein